MYLRSAQRDKHPALTGLRWVGATCFYKHTVLIGLKKIEFFNRLGDGTLPKTLHTQSGNFS